MPPHPSPRPAARAADRLRTGPGGRRTRPGDRPPGSSIYGVTTTSPSDTGPSAEKTTVPVGVRTVTETTSRPEPNAPPSSAYPVTMYPGWPALGPTTVKSTRRPDADDDRL